MTELSYNWLLTRIKSLDPRVKPKMTDMNEYGCRFLSPTRSLLLLFLDLFRLLEIFSSRTPEILVQSSLRDIDFTLRFPIVLKLNNKPNVDF